MLLVDVRSCEYRLQTFFSDGFHPDSLPYTCYAGVVAACRVETEALFASRLLVVAEIIVHEHHQIVLLTSLHEFCDVAGERACAEVTAHEFSVDEDVCLIIHRSKVEQYLFPVPCGRNVDLALIPDGIDEISIFHS